MSKKKRLDAIIDIINRQEIATQDELTEKLILLGFDVSQSTVSRDINELNLVKAEGKDKKFKYVQAGIDKDKTSPQMVNMLKQIVTSIECANNLIVIKTLGGHAGSAGMAVDGMHFKQILGTVAGDDTLLIVAKSNSDAEILVKTLRNL